MRRRCGMLCVAADPAPANQTRRGLAPQHFVNFLLSGARNHHEAVRQASSVQRIIRVGGLFSTSRVSTDRVSYESSVKGRCRNAALLIVRLVDRAVALHLEALTIESDDLLGLLVLQPAYHRRNIDGLAGKVLQHCPAPKQEFLERGF